jgi:hypothetical protein
MLPGAIASLADEGFVHATGPFPGLDDAWRAAQALVDASGPENLEVIGDFVIPPPDGPPSREFQTLHFDNGVPLAPAVPGDVARFTALHIVAEASSSDAVTRLVPLRALLAARSWPHREQLVQRFAAYGISHGAWDDADGYVEGSLARIIEAALGETPVLASVKTQPHFLCGTEFASIDAEHAFLVQRDLRPDAVEVEIRLRLASCWSSTTSRSLMGAAGAGGQASCTSASSGTAPSPRRNRSPSATEYSARSPISPVPYS